jgi:penicillin-binding protein 1C
VHFSTVCLFFVADKAYPLKHNDDYSQMILASDGSILHVFLSNDDKWRLKAEWNDISPSLRKTIVFKEDRYFYWHFGINPFAVFRAVVLNIFKGERVSGASTITMQLARLLEPRTRTYGHKLIEMFRSVQLEWHCSKNDILLEYLNHLPYGGNIEGVKSASLIYFQQMPEALSLSQLVTLSIIPNNPSRYAAGSNMEQLRSDRDRWLKKFEGKQLFEMSDVADALNEPLEIVRNEMPGNIPHLAVRLHQSFPQYPVLQTSIDPELQSRIETIVSSFILPLKGNGISNAAVLVVRNRDRHVVSYLGSADFNDAGTFGQVDGVKAVRSPGSTLKPYLYALAIDKGIITPQSVLSDVPVNYDGYDPENYDGDYRGQITAENALALSLNIPAVNLLSRMGEEAFFDRLTRAGFGKIERQRKELGLSVILGGCGVTLEELTGLYASFADGGNFSALNYLGSIQEFRTDSLVSEASAFMITEILTRLKRPDFPANTQQVISLPKVAWKTGTSYGRKDAWSIGYNPDFTVGVWVGNFQARGVPELNGSDYAAPLLFRIFTLLDEGHEVKWFKEPPGVHHRIVCSRSGLPPNSFCDDLITGQYIPGVSPAQKCEHMRLVHVNADSNLSYCRSCLPATGYIDKYYPNYPPEIIAYMSENDIPFERIPAHNPACERIFQDNAPVITSLTPNAEYFLFRGENQRLRLSCHSENDVNTVYWYLNDEFLESSDPEKPVFVEPPEGGIKISCVDDKGRNTDIRIKVKFL